MTFPYHADNIYEDHDLKMTNRPTTLKLFFFWNIFSSLSYFRSVTLQFSPTYWLVLPGSSSGPPLVLLTPHIA